MFPEYRDLISKLKTTDQHFVHLFDKHNDLDHQIKNMDNRVVTASDTEIEALKREKLHLKDQLYGILQKAAAKSA